MKNIIFGALLLISLNSFADGCSGAATFTATYNSAQCCWTFTNTTNNDCGSSGICTWNFADGSPTITTIQGASTICHQFANLGTYTVPLTFVPNKVSNAPVVVKRTKAIKFLLGPGTILRTRPPKTI